jgi:hypothetical protein
MKPRPRLQKPSIPPEVLYVLKYGKNAYVEHPSWGDEPDDVCMDVFLLCGKLIRDRDEGPKLWNQYRGELLKRAGIRTWWCFKKFEAKCEK